MSENLQSVQKRTGLGRKAVAEFVVDFEDKENQRNPGFDPAILRQKAFKALLKAFGDEPAEEAKEMKGASGSLSFSPEDMSKIQALSDEAKVLPYPMVLHWFQTARERKHRVKPNEPISFDTLADEFKNDVLEKNSHSEVGVRPVARMLNVTPQNVSYHIRKLRKRDENLSLMDALKLYMDMRAPARIQAEREQKALGASLRRPALGFTSEQSRKLSIRQEVANDIKDLAIVFNQVENNKAEALKYAINTVLIGRSMGIVSTIMDGIYDSLQRSEESGDFKGTFMSLLPQTLEGPLKDHGLDVLMPAQVYSSLKASLAEVVEDFLVTRKFDGQKVKLGEVFTQRLDDKVREHLLDPKVRRELVSAAPEILKQGIL